MIACAYDTRPEAEPGLRLLVASVNKNCSSLRLRVYFDHASDALRDMIANNMNVELHSTPRSFPRGVDVKPSILIQLLREGYKDVLWIDTDVIVTANVVRALDNIEEGALVLTEEGDTRGYLDQDGARSRLWGYSVGRNFPFVLNTAVIRVGPEHTDLLQAWRDCLNSELYRNAQRLPWHQRPVELMSDQDVLHALLCSEEYSSVTVHILRRGRSIIQEIGRRPASLRCWFTALVHGLPPFVHSQKRPKPWDIRATRGQGIMSYLSQVQDDLSAYKTLSRCYADVLNPEDPWFSPKTSAGKAIIFLSGDKMIVSLLVIGLISDVVIPFLLILGIAKRRVRCFLASAKD